MKAMGIKQGDEVITQAFTSCNLEAILAQGKPVITDIKSLNMCPND